MNVDINVEILTLIFTAIGLIITIYVLYSKSRKELLEKLHQAEIELEKKHREIETKSTELIYHLNKEHINELHTIKIDIAEVKKDHILLLPLINAAKKAGEKGSDEVYREETK